jgi:hypothetical protein
LRRLGLIALLLGILAASLSVSAPAGADNAGRCSTRGFHFRYSSDHIKDLSVRGMGCGQALYDLHNAFVVAWPPNLRVANFQCHVLSGTKNGANDRCVRERMHKSLRVTVYR